MSRIDDLIQQHCPNGVEYRALGDLLVYTQPTKYLVSSTTYDPNNPIPVLTAGQTFILGYTDETSGVYAASPANPVIIFDDFTTASKWVNFPFKAKSSAMKMLALRSEAPASLRYIWYAMQLVRYSPQDHARQWISTYSAFRIPVPPITVQQEIVRVLDLFQSLEAELEAELEARHFQLAHYRDSLMAFDDSVPLIPIGELGEIYRGRRFTKGDYVYDGLGLPAIHYGELYTEYGIAATNTVTRVRAEMEPTLRFAQPGDVVIAEVGETVEDVGKATAWLGDTNVAIHDGCYGFRHSMNPKFVAYYLQTAAYHAEKSRFVARAKVKRLSLTGIRQVRLPVPPLAEQERIVAILDKFDALVNDLSVGLPAELAARRKQYEYYRDRLLTFEEAA
ncbi:MAG: restriction endonuclease subunit S [Microthrixaceae bacterium]|nr:restriction endonuclease subunit S [Microthrixaceae bacterium]